MLLVCGFWASSLSLSRGEENFERELKAVAEAIVQFLNTENLNKIAIRKFDGPSSFPASAGPGIAEVLVTHFKMKRFEVVGLSTKADVAVTGKYRLRPTDDGPLRPKLVELVVSFSLEDEFGNPFEKFGDQGKMELRTRESDEIAEKIGLPVAFDISSESEDKRKEKDHAVLLDVYKHPKADIQNGIEVKRADSPYGVQVLVKDSPKQIKDQNGLAFCELGRGDEFEILLRNDSEYDAAVDLRLDGINTFHFSKMRSATDESKPLYMNYIVPKKSKSRVSGWHLDNDKIRKYRITGIENSAAMLANADVEIGTISASFSAAWQFGDRIPPGELTNRSLRYAKDSGNFIGLGDEKTNTVKAVSREIGRVRETLVVRYRK